MGQGKKGLIEGPFTLDAAQALVRTWATAPPKAFSEAELKAAQGELARAEKDIADLNGRLAEAERRVAAARARVRLLGGAA